MIFPCSCKSNVYNFNNSYWEEKKTTSDEIEIVNFLLNYQKKNNIKNILHIGIGNSYLAKKFRNFNFKIDGITISKREANFAIKEGIKNYEVYLINKYSNDFQIFKQKRTYDLIIDSNLKSYSCCAKSFNNFFNNLNSMLKKNSIILTSRKGMNWSKFLKRKLSFNLTKLFYYKLKEYKSLEKNILSISLCKILAVKYNLFLFYNNRITYFKKK